MLRDRRLWPYIAAPIAVTTVLMVSAWWTAFSLAPDVVAAIADHPAGPGWANNLRRGMWFATSAAVHVGLLAVSSVIAWIVGGVIASPVYDRLSARVEAIELGDPSDEAFSWSLVAGDVIQGVSHSLLALVLYISVACPLALLGIVPVFGQLAEVIIGTLLSCLFLAREVLDYSLSRRRYSFRQKLDLVWTHRGVTFGLGLTTFGFLWIPFANFLSMPAAVIGATVLYCDLEKAGLTPGLPGAQERA